MSDSVVPHQSLSDSVVPRQSLSDSVVPHESFSDCVSPYQSLSDCVSPHQSLCNCVVPNQCLSDCAPYQTLSDSRSVLVIELSLKRDRYAILAGGRWDGEGGGVIQNRGWG